MSKEYGGMGVSADLGQTLDRPFVEILSKIFEAELLDEPEALNNLAWSLQALGSMTLDQESSSLVNQLNDLIHRVHALINLHLDNEINSMKTRDDDIIAYQREYCKNAISRVTRVISRCIIKIVTFSFTNGPMSGCTIKNTSKLGFNTKTELENALRSVSDELITLGLEDVAAALNGGADGIMIMTQQKVKKVQPRCPQTPPGRCPVVHALTAEEKCANEDALFHEIAWAVKWNNRRR